MGTQRVRAALYAAGALTGFAALLGAGGSWAQQRTASRVIETTEIAPFRMTGIDGYVLGRYWQDSNDTATGGFGSNQSLSNLSGEIFVMTHNYVYHPNLLLLDLGAGPVIYRQGYSSDSVDSMSNKATYNLTGRASFLRSKPYRGDVFYERKNDSQPVGPAQTLLTENTRYGFDFALLAPVTPVPIRVDANRFTSKGKGTDQVIDERIDELNFRAERSFGKLGDTRFRYQAVQDDSASGSVGLPIQVTRSRTARADLDTQLNFGAKNEYDLINTVSAFTQDYSAAQGAISDTRQLRFDVNLQGRHSDALRTHARYQFDALDQSVQAGNQSARLNGVNAGVTYQANPDLSGTLQATGTFNRNTSFNANMAGINGSVYYRHALPLGEVAANYRLAYFRRDQTAMEAFPQVVGERVTLSGTSWVTLQNPRVVTGTVVVSNVQRTQIYVEGLDYALDQLGLDTRIQRLIGGNILDRQEVLLDYEFDAGGTYAITEFDNAVDLTWSLKRYFSIYARYIDSSPSLVSGRPTSPLNPGTSRIYGVRADVPVELLTEEVTLGGMAEREDRREVISPYQRNTLEAYVDSPLPLIARGGIRISARQQNTAYDYTPAQDLDSTTYNLKLWTRIRDGPGLSIEATRTRDTGPLLPTRQYTTASAKALWRLRRFRMSLDVSRTRESQGTTQTLHTRGELILRRDF